MFRGGEPWKAPALPENPKRSWYGRLCWVLCLIAIISVVHYIRVRWIEDQYMAGFKEGVNAVLQRDVNLCVDTIRELRKGGHGSSL